jgi:hypothetical protein
MSKQTLQALCWGPAVTLYLRFGLEATGWLFYEASHALGVDWLYWGYSIFRAGGYAFSLWSLQTPVCVVLGAVVALLLIWRAMQRESR